MYNKFLSIIILLTIVLYCITTDKNNNNNILHHNNNEHFMDTCRINKIPHKKYFMIPLTSYEYDTPLINNVKEPYIQKFDEEYILYKYI